MASSLFALTRFLVKELHNGERGDAARRDSTCRNPCCRRNAEGAHGYLPARSAVEFDIKECWKIMDPIYSYMGICQVVKEKKNALKSEVIRNEQERSFVRCEE
jgi:hypothetical protein